MVKKNLVNKNVVRALSIGLSLAMASQPLTAMAATEGDAGSGDVQNQAQGEATSQSDTAAAKTAATNAATESADATTKTNTVLQDELAQDLAQNLPVAGVQDELGNVTSDLGLNNDSKSKADAEIATAQTELNKIDEAAISEDRQEALDDAYNAVEAKETGARAVAEKIVTDTEKAVKDAEKVVNGSEEEEIESTENKIKGATTIGGVNAAYNTAKDAVDGAATTVENAETKLAAAVTDFNTKKENFETLKTAYNNAVEDANTAAVNAATAAENAEGDLKALYQEAKLAREATVDNVLRNPIADGHDGNATNVTLKTGSLAKLEAAVEAAKEEYIKAGQGKIVAMEKALQARVDNDIKEDDVNWKEGKDVDRSKDALSDTVKYSYRDLFREVVRFYYGPEVLGIDPTAADELTFRWVEPGLSGTYTFEQDGETINSTPGNVLKYCEVKYKVKDENGNVVKDAEGKAVTRTINLNFKLAESNDAKKFGGLVIFEKTAHTSYVEDTIVNGKHAYEATDLTDEQRDTLNALKEGETTTDVISGRTFIKKDGKFYAFVDEDVPATTYDKEITRDENGVVTQEKEKSNKAEDVDISYTYADGQIKKTVSTKVTTTTYTGASLDAQGATYTEDQLDVLKTAYLNELKAKVGTLAEGDSVELSWTVKDSEGKDETVKKTVSKAEFDAITIANIANYGYVQTVKTDNEKDVKVFAGYQVSGTYNKAFTATVSTSTSEKDEEDDARDALKKELEKELKYAYQYHDDDVPVVNYLVQLFGGPKAHQQEYDLVDGDNSITYGSVTITPKPHQFIWSWTDYVASGSATAEYYKLSNSTIDNYFALSDEVRSWFSGSHRSDEIKEKLRDELAKQGKKFIKLDGWDGNIGQATFYYVDAVEVSSTDNMVVNVAENATDDQILATFETKLGSSAKNVRVTDAKKAYTDGKAKYNTYGYQGISLLKTVVSVETDKKIYEEVIDVKGQVRDTYRNDNWYSGNILASTTDKYTTDKKNDVEKTVDENHIVKAQQTIDNFDTLITKIRTAQTEVKDAEAKVISLETAILALKNGLSKETRTIAELQADLTNAKTLLAELQTKLTELETLRDQRVAALIPAPSGEGGGETGGEGGTTTAPGLTVLPGAEAPLAAGPAMFVAAPAAAGPAAAAPAAAPVAPTTQINQPETARAAAVPEKDANQPEEVINNNQVALAAAPINEETLSWWWLLIIAVLGGAGYAMYKKFHAKKDEKTTN